MNEFISVIMSTYNEKEEWLRKSIESILNQTHKNFEFIIVLDNPENRQIEKILFDYSLLDKRIKIIKNEVNLGLIKSLNKAILISNGEYIARMDADDISLENRLEHELEYMISNKLDIVMSCTDTIDEEDSVFHEKEKKQLNSSSFNHLISYCNISTHPTWLIKKNVYQVLNGYREVKYCEDYDFILRAIQENFKCGKMSEKLLLYRIRSNSITRSNVLEQFIKSFYIKDKYKKNILICNIDTSTIEKAYLDISEKEKNVFFRSYKEFQYIKTNFKKMGYIKSIIKMFFLFMKSKYFKIYLIDNLKWIRIANKNGI